MILSNIFWAAISSSIGSGRLPEIAKSLAPYVRWALGKFRHENEVFLDWCTGLVVVGVFLEVFEIVHELREKFGPFKIHRPDRKWIPVVGFVGWMLIVVGVAGELWFGHRVSIKNEELESLSNSLLGDAQLAATEAITQSRNSLSRNVALGIELQNAEVDVANATKRAADANREADEERIERLKLEKQIAPRRLTSQQKSALSGTCARFPYRRVAVVSYMADTESLIFSSQILEALNCKLGSFSVDDQRSSELPAGVLFGMQIKGTDESLVRALKEDLSPLAITPDWMTPPPVDLKIGTGESTTASAIILVGAKPLWRGPVTVSPH